MKVKPDLASQAQPPPSLRQSRLGGAKRPAQNKRTGCSNLNMAGGMEGPDVNSGQVMVPDKAEIVSNIQMAHESDGLPEPIDQANAKIESIFTAEVVGGGMWVRRHVERMVLDLKLGLIEKGGETIKMLLEQTHAQNMIIQVG